MSCVLFWGGRGEYCKILLFFSTKFWITISYKTLPTDMTFSMAGVGLRREVHRGLFSE